jgi:hypothetical protein
MKQAEESRVYTAFANAIETQAAKFAKADSGSKRLPAQWLADALAVVFRSIAASNERE